MSLDLITHNEHGSIVAGDVATRLMESGFNVNAMRPYFNNQGRPMVTTNIGGKDVARMTANATLRKDEWKQLDDALLDISLSRLGAVNDLNSAGLNLNITNGLGTTSLQYEDVSDITDAEVSMDGVSQSGEDRPEYDIISLPLPIVHKDFSFNLRELSSSRSRGVPLDVTMAEKAARKVLETVENMLILGQSGFTHGSGTIRGYLDVTSRNTVTLTANWNATGKTGAQIVTDVLNMKAAAIAAKHYGPYMLYVPTAYETVLDQDHTTGYPKTTRQRLLEINNITDVRVLDSLTANNVLLIQMSSDVARMVNALPLTTVEWDSNGGMRKHFKVMTIQVPQIRADQDGNSGVTHLSV